jgi:pimeloyl-ACP methyl ester carboxylesterase
MASWVDRWWQAPGPDALRLHARDYPAAPGDARLPVVCIHGLTRNARDFEDLAPRIASGGLGGAPRRVLAVDVRGRGQSAYDPQPQRYLPATYAGDILALLDQAGIGRAVFVGTSMGGLITLVVSALRPAAVAAAVLNDIGPEIGAAGLARIAAYTGKAAPVTDWTSAAGYARTVNAAAFPHYDQAQWEVFARRLFKDGPSGPVLDYDPDIAVPMRPPALQPGEAAPPPPDLWPLFHGLAARPLLTLRGETSDILTPDIAQRMREAAPQMAYAQIEGVGHAPMLDEPQALAALGDLLASVA